MPRSPRGKPRPITDGLLRRWPLPGPSKEGSKEERGRVLIIAGAVQMPGAAILASMAALRAGAGKVRVATAEEAALAVGTAVPELFVHAIAEGKRRASSLKAILDSAKNADAVLIGPGMRDQDAIRTLLPELLRIEDLRALIVDATALPIATKFLAHRNSLAGKTIITPHAAEMASLCDLSVEEVERDSQQIAQQAARRFQSIVVLKGAETLICSESGPAYLNRRGNVGLATAGSGDVLAGILAGLCARGTDPLRAAMWAVALHARAGENLARRLGPIGYLAREIIDEIPLIIRQI
jgi:ADP-dependent NAD(P)H-hydrate dehydratase